MKLFRRLSLLLFGTLLVLSCGLNPGSGSGSGDLIIDLGFAKGSQDTARVWILTTNNVLVPIGTGGAPYAEVSLAADTTEVVVDNIPAGVNYRVYFALGSKDSTQFQVDKYGVSDVFSVTGGTEESVALGPLTDSPFTYSNAVGSFKGVVFDGTLYAPTTNVLYKGPNIASLTPVSVPAGYTVNSISIGTTNDTVGGDKDKWLNTNKGILPTNGTAFDQTFAQFHKDGDGNPISVLSSGFFQIGTFFIIYQRDGGLGGVKDNGSPTVEGQYKWIDIDLSDVITGQPVKDMVLISTEGAFFASKLGAFFLDNEFLNVPGGDANFLDYSIFFGQSLGLTVISLAFGNGEFVLGTETGLYQSADLDTNPASPTLTLVPGTAGRRFERVSRSPTDDIAAISTYFLWVKRSTDTNFRTPTPFAAGLPGNVTRMAWVGAGQLVISGTEGLVQITLLP